MRRRLMSGSPVAFHSQRGMALLVSLVFLLLLTLIGISSMQNATLQEKMANSVTLRNQSFQAAEAALRIGESAVQLDTYTLPVCSGTTRCAPPAESSLITAAGFNSTSGVTWIAAGSGFYGVQNIGTTLAAVNVPSNTSATLYRVTAVAIVGNNVRSVVESIYAKY
jgi:type IV pilus assembly protein PilX